MKIHMEMTARRLTNGPGQSGKVTLTEISLLVSLSLKRSIIYQKSLAFVPSYLDLKKELASCL